MKEKTLTTLWARINERGDFPTLRRNINNIVSAMHNQDASTTELVAVILSDFTLTQQVIRLANSAMYATFGGKVTTVSRALAILGSDAVGHLALGLQLVDNFLGLAETQGAAKRELERVRWASEYARSITTDKGAKEAEEAVVATLMQSLARLLVVFYFPEAWLKIQTLAEHGLSLSQACAQVLGLSFEELAANVTKTWQIPGEITEALNPCALDTNVPLATHSEWLGAVATIANQVADRATTHEPIDAVRAHLASHAAWLGVDPERLTGAALEAAVAMAQAETPEAAPTTPTERGFGKPVDAGARLLRSVDEVAALAGTQHPNALAPLVLESWMQALGFERCFSMFVNYGAKRFEGKVGFGAGMPAMLPRLVFEQGFVPDVFHLALTQRNAVFIAEATRADFRSRLPLWYQREFSEIRSFVILPLYLRNQAVGLFYGDWGTTACTSLSPEEIAAMHSLGALLMQGFERLLTAAPGTKSALA